MIVEMIRRSFIGLGFTAIFTFAILTFMMVRDVQASVSVVWLNMLGSMVMGIYFGSSSLIFETENWSPLKQTIVHFVVSLLVWFPLAMFMKWLPLELLPILLGIGIFIAIYLVFWFGSYVYFKYVASEMNHSLRK
ncbi:DUF3021 domain-containing protein [Bacillus sp. PS06]|uniref:DUF3021 domain-containing protein n=1 Tax=Bacillus sp. PS06 TaxID=2764176 RepID=UPI0017852F73|nr:DUF3021 domain-containing protein [Bacillus sp. PS06]MBD8070668.1 DUF3021 domain-containing protein [Bacillus sp. PS06]